MTAHSLDTVDDPCQAALDALFEQREALAERWLQEVKSDAKVPSSEEVTEPQLIDSLPQVLEQIISVASGRTAAIRAEKIGFAERHGRERACQDFDPRELVREYQVLRYVIFQELERIVSRENLKSDAAVKVGRRLGEALDEALRTTIGAFVTQQTDNLVEMSRRDGLTGLLNHRSFYEELERRLQASNRSGRPFAVAILDLDGFKEVNDHLGHRVGDQALVAWAKKLSGRLRETDIVCRYGGDEFAAILSGANRGSAIPLLEDIASEPVQIAEVCEGVEGFSRSTIDISCGIAEWPGDGATAGQLVEAADFRLRAIKRRR